MPAASAAPASVTLLVLAYVKPAGRLSTTVTPLTDAAPVLLTVSVYVACVPLPVLTTDGVVAVLPTFNTAAELTLTLSALCVAPSKLAMLLRGVVVVALALLSYAPSTTPAAIWATKVIVTLAPLGSVKSPHARRRAAHGRIGDAAARGAAGQHRRAVRCVS